MKNLKLSTKIMSTIVASLFMLTLSIMWLYPQMYKSLMAEKRDTTQDVVQTAWSMVDHYANEAANGSLTLEEAQTLAMAAIKALRYMDNNYFWIQDDKANMLMHPIKSSLDGKNLSSLKDKNGKHFFSEFGRISKENGAGFVDYYWPKPGEEQPKAKISYVKLQSDWGWIIGSGIYIDDVRRDLNSKFGLIFGIIGVIIILSILGAYFITRSITRPLTNSITTVELGSVQMTEASEQIAVSSQTLADGTSEQAAALEETSASLEELSAMTRQNAGNAEEVKSLMGEAKISVSDSTESMGQVISAMQDISTASEETQKIIKTIDEIAFQTNLLSLNAAVEAARAGEAGAGFAVVADEVRTLAMRASEAAKNTSELIENSATRIKDGTSLVNKCNDDFGAVAQNAQKVAVLVDEIAVAATEQAQGISQISIAVTEMDQVTQNNAANAEESSAASEEMDALAEQLQQTVVDMKLLISGAAQRKSSTAPAQIFKMPKVENNILRPAWREKFKAVTA